jgi:hypothetical protein
MKQGENYNYEIVKINHRTHTHSVLEVVKGESLAIGRAERYKSKLTPEERDAGWSCYAGRTTKPVSYRPDPSRGPLKRGGKK